MIILTPGFPADEADSTCIPPQQVFMRSLKSQYPQWDIIILSFQYPYQSCSYSWNGIPVISFGGRNKGGLARRLLWRRVENKLKQLNREKNINALLSFWCGECTLIGKRFAQKNRLPHFSWVLGQDAKKDNHYVKRIDPKPAELIALSDFIQFEFEKNHGVRPAHIVAPGIDPRLFATTKTERDIDILAAGSLIPLKQYDIFIRVIARLKKQKPDINAVLAGNGPEKDKLLELITELNLENNVRLAGEVPHPVVLGFMQCSKIFLHPSSYEGFGVVCIEALYAGASVISFTKPMKEEIKNWRIAADTENMIELAGQLLQTTQPCEPVLFNPIENTVTQIAQLLSRNVS